MSHDRAFEALGDPTRRRVFELLSRGPLAVGELAEQMPVSRPAVSQHLRVLKEAGLVVERPEGARRLYSVQPDGLAELRAYMDRMWGDVLDGFKQAADAKARGMRRGRSGGRGTKVGSNTRRKGER
jgi:DNA-binding transcriptional ArsR family regulator